MSVLEKLYKKDTLITKTLCIESELYEKLEYLTKEIYDIPMNKLINACIDEFIEKENLKIYEYGSEELLVKKTFALRKYSLDGLSKLKSKYRISIYRLINIAIRNVLEDIILPKRD